MKITSKFTDFYEYDCYRYGEPDQSIEWYRALIEENINKNDEIFRYIKKRYLLSSNALANKKIGKSENGYPCVTITENIIGIYPYVYYLPRIVFKERWEAITDLSIADSLKCLTIKNAWKEIFKNKNININKIVNLNQIVNAGKDILNFVDNSGIKITGSIIIEDKEIFDYFKEPIFHICVDQSSSDYIYYDHINAWVNPCLCADTPLLEYYPNILNDRDIYTDIENFLWSQKQEPMVIPDNKTKILSHGFDLKTSFRKM